MPTVPHIEKHFTAGETVRDAVIGMSDGLTVPFALAAGLSGAVAATHIVITAGVAEVAAGAISMGLGGYLAARSDADHYASELAREEREIVEMPEAEVAEVVGIFRTYGLSPAEADQVASALRQRPAAWRDFMMRFELGLEAPNPRRAVQSAATIAGAYIVGGMVPLVPYFLTDSVRQGLLVSSVVTMLALVGFGVLKARFTGVPKLRGALQTTIIGALAAGTAFVIARAVM